MHRRPAPRIERQLVIGAVATRTAEWAEAFFSRLEREVAHSEAAHLTSHCQILFEQGGRERQHVAEIVKAVAGIIYRERRAGLNVYGQQIPNRIAVLGPVQAVNDGRARIGIALSRAIQRAFQPVDKGRHLGRFGFGRIGRRHLPGADFAQDLLPNCRVAADMIEIQTFQHDVGGSGFLVMTGDAIFLDQRALCREVDAVCALRLRGRARVVNASDASEQRQAQLQPPFFHTFSFHGLRYSRATYLSATGSFSTRSVYLFQVMRLPERRAIFPSKAVVVERCPISMSQIGAWRDFKQSRKLRACIAP